MRTETTGLAERAEDGIRRAVEMRRLRLWRWGLLGLVLALAAGELLWGRRGDGIPFVLLAVAIAVVAVNHRLRNLQQLDRPDE